MSNAKIRTPYDQAKAVADELLKKLSPACDKIVIVGSLRRGLETIGDIDLLCLPKEPALLESLTSDLSESQVIGVGGNWMMTGTFQGISFNVCKTVPKSWGASLLHCTGSVQFNIDLRSLAKGKGFSLNQNGLWLKTGDEEQLVAGVSEDEVFRALNLQYVEAKHRINGETLKSVVGDLEWTVLSSSGDKSYRVGLTDGEWYCECPGFKYRQKCRHVDDKKKEIG